MLTRPTKDIALFQQLFIFFFCMSSFFSSGWALADNSTQFPIYQIIAPNVSFWEKVYDTYNSRQGILHDKNNLTIIYGVIDLVDWNTPGAARINKNLVKLARHRYKKILTDLSQGHTPQTKEEKRIAALCRTNKRHNYLKLRDNIRLQIGQKDRFLQGVIRSGAYLDTIQAIFRVYALPAELAYLPHVESSFNPEAQSKSGAVGLWQFTKATGKEFMTINSILDERYDLFLSSKAAAKLLKNNYRQLGSWPLALTAYNYGRPGMVRALEEQKSYENIFKHHKTRLFQFASRNFYSEFVAAIRVAKKLEKNHSIIRDRPAATVSIRMAGYADSRKIRQYFKLSRQDFSRFNPALRKPVLDGKKYIPKGYLLWLPATKLTRQRMGTMGTKFYHSRQIQDRIYTVQRGDTISSIARKLGISSKGLILANQLNSTATIRIGQKLIVPNRKTGKINRNIVVLKDNSKYHPRR